MDVIDPLPYYAGLAKVLHGPTLALVLTYLEFEHPSPQDPSEDHLGRPDEPVILDCDIASTALGVSRRTLHISLSCLGRCWGTEEGRVQAARVGREFINTAHSSKPNGYDTVKPYSFTGPRSYSGPQSLTMRRNYPKLDSILTLAGILPPTSPIIENVDFCRSVRCLLGLPTILAENLPDWGDRRSERWDRWRRENGKKSQNPGRMRGAKIVVSSVDEDASIDAI